MHYFNTYQKQSRSSFLFTQSWLGHIILWLTSVNMSTWAPYSNNTKVVAVLPYRLAICRADRPRSYARQPPTNMSRLTLQLLPHSCSNHLHVAIANISFVLQQQLCYISLASYTGSNQRGVAPGILQCSSSWYTEVQEFPCSARSVHMQFITMWQWESS